MLHFMYHHITTDLRSLRHIQGALIELQCLFHHISVLHIALGSCMGNITCQLVAIVAIHCLEKYFHVL